MAPVPATTYSPYFVPGHIVPTMIGPDPGAVTQYGPAPPPPPPPVQQQAVMPQPQPQQKIPRSDRPEIEMKTTNTVYYENVVSIFLTSQV